MPTPKSLPLRLLASFGLPVRSAAVSPRQRRSVTWASDVLEDSDVDANTSANAVASAYLNGECRSLAIRHEAPPPGTKNKNRPEALAIAAAGNGSDTAAAASYATAAKMEVAASAAAAAAVAAASEAQKLAPETPSSLGSTSSSTSSNSRSSRSSSSSSFGRRAGFASAATSTTTRGTRDRESSGASEHTTATKDNSSSTVGSDSGPPPRPTIRRNSSSGSDGGGGGGAPPPTPPSPATPPFPRHGGRPRRVVAADNLAALHRAHLTALRHQEETAKAKDALQRENRDLKRENEFVKCENKSLRQEFSEALRDNQAWCLENEVLGQEYTQAFLAKTANVFHRSADLERDNERLVEENAEMKAAAEEAARRHSEVLRESKAWRHENEILHEEYTEHLMTSAQILSENARLKEQIAVSNLEFAKMATSRKAHVKVLTRKVKAALGEDVGGAGEVDGVSGGEMSDRDGDGGSGGAGGDDDDDDDDSLTIMALERKLQVLLKKKQQQKPSQASGKGGGGDTGGDQGSGDMAEMLPLRASRRRAIPCSSDSGDCDEDNGKANPRAKRADGEEEKDEGNEGDEDEDPLRRGRDDSNRSSEDFFDSFTSFWTDKSVFATTDKPDSTMINKSKSSVETALGRWSGGGSVDGGRNDSMEITTYDSEQERRPIPAAPPLTLPTVAGPRIRPPLSTRKSQQQQQQQKLLMQQQQRRKKQQLPRAWKDEHVNWLKKTKAWQQVNRILTKSLDLTAELQQDQDQDQYNHHHYHRHQQPPRRQHQRWRQDQKENAASESNKGGCAAGSGRDRTKRLTGIVDSRMTVVGESLKKRPEQREQQQQKEKEADERDDVGCAEGGGEGSGRRENGPASSREMDDGEAVDKNTQQQHLQLHLDQHTRTLTLAQKMALMMESRGRQDFVDTMPHAAQSPAVAQMGAGDIYASWSEGSSGEGSTEGEDI